MWLLGTRLSPWDRSAVVYHMLRPSLGTEASVVECVTLCVPRRPARMKLCSRSPASTASAPTQPAYLCTLPQRGRLRSLWISAVGQRVSQASGTLRVPERRGTVLCLVPKERRNGGRRNRSPSARPPCSPRSTASNSRALPGPAPRRGGRKAASGCFLLTG